MTVLFQNQTNNGFSSEFPESGEHQGGSVWLSITGTMDGATVRIAIDQDGLGFNNLQGVDQTLTDVNEIFLGVGQRLRLQLLNAGASTDISASVV